ncbi:MAG: hypothetical protein CVU72_02470 [Deltaproteobacteria bacterium HGW-Deltaproteobacteria-7]|jgi:hypothetical protein|nr:MAG: hypothetical protein CVU72_02470 [Deltaproteobacteria bacterium HGW-Deltaproteobacteria-7]PKN18652.1 MAG: hypothetical protein CVU71_14340 [Deltaproteobacteria bacterium HGW-Deltaproteobacteria-6]
MKPRCIKKILLIITFLFIAAGGWQPQVVNADDAKEAQPSVIRMIKDGFSADLRIMPYGIVQKPATSTQNPDNNFLNLTHYTANLELRPDFKLDLNFLELSAKPRAKLEFRIWEEGNRRGETQWKDDWYVNEWLVRLKARENLFVSYGRENLQWGPSFLFSPSNPFFRDNGRSNPYVEVQGMEFGRLVFIPHSSWTVSAIVNTDEGRNTLLGTDPFEKTYALKADYTGRENYASIIISQKDYNKTLGFFGGWTISDAVLIYGEGSFMKGSNALYPRTDGSSLGASMQKIHQNDSDIKPIMLIGSSYTLEANGTFSLEYAYNGPGYNRDEAEIYCTLRRRGAAAFNMGGLAGLLGQSTLGQTINPGLRYLRKHYGMFQYSQNNIKNKIDLTLRWTQNLDDGSGQFLTLVSYSLGNHLELFSSGMVSAGGGDAEFRSTLDYQLMFGLKYTL